MSSFTLCRCMGTTRLKNLTMMGILENYHNRKTMHKKKKKKVQNVENREHKDL